MFQLLNKKTPVSAVFSKSDIKFNLENFKFQITLRIQLIQKSLKNITLHEQSFVIESL